MAMRGRVAGATCAEGRKVGGGAYLALTRYAWLIGNCTGGFVRRSVSMKTSIQPLTLLVFGIVFVSLVVPGRATLCPRGESLCTYMARARILAFTLAMTFYACIQDYLVGLGTCILGCTASLLNLRTQGVDCFSYVSISDFVFHC